MQPRHKHNSFYTFLENNAFGNYFGSCTLFTKKRNCVFIKGTPNLLTTIINLNIMMGPLLTNGVATFISVPIPSKRPRPSPQRHPRLEFRLIERRKCVYTARYVGLYTYIKKKVAVSRWHWNDARTARERSVRFMVRECCYYLRYCCIVVVGSPKIVQDLRGKFEHDELQMYSRNWWIF